MENYSGALGASNVSVVVCVKDGALIIAECLTRVLRNGPKELIVVDGLSSDNTVEIAESFPGVITISDQGRGLAHARQVGATLATGDYVMFVGPDNLVDDFFIDDFVRLKNDGGFHGASAQTRVFQPGGFWDRGFDFRWQCLMGKPGPIHVLGTPSLYDRAIFDNVSFAESEISAADDTDFAERLTAQGYSLGLVPLKVYESNGWGMRSTWGRFQWYGDGDFYFYQKWSPAWALHRRLKSIGHPFLQTLRFSGKALASREIAIIFWLIFAMTARYYGWLRRAFGANC